MANLDAIQFSESLLGILNSLIVLDKCNHFVFQWQLLQFLHVLGLHGTLLAGGCPGYSLPLAEGELARSQWNKPFCSQFCKERINSFGMFIQSLNAEVNSMYVFVLKFHFIYYFFRRLAWLGVVKSIIAAARVTFAVNTVLRFESLQCLIPSSKIRYLLQLCHQSSKSVTYLKFIDSYKHHATCPKYGHRVHFASCCKILGHFHSP